MELFIRVYPSDIRSDCGGCASASAAPDAAADACGSPWLDSLWYGDDDHQQTLVVSLYVSSYEHIDDTLTNLAKWSLI